MKFTNFKKLSFASLATVIFSIDFAQAGPFTANDLVVNDKIEIEVPKNAKISKGYFPIRKHGYLLSTGPCTLLLKSEAAGKALLGKSLNLELSEQRIWAPVPHKVGDPRSRLPNPKSNGAGLRQFKVSNSPYVSEIKCSFDTSKPQELQGRQSDSSYFRIERPRTEELKAFDSDSIPYDFGGLGAGGFI